MSSENTESTSLLKMEADAREAENRAQKMGRLSLDEEGQEAPSMGRADVCEEAAALFAAGRPRDAASLLTAELNNKKGKCPKALWYMLMDIYQVTGQQGAFDKLALFFAKVFGSSPPSWETVEAPKVGFGRNVLIVEGPARDIHQEKVKDFLAASRSMRQARLDLSRARLDGDEAAPMASALRLMDVLPKVRKLGIPVFLMGESQMMSEIRNRIRTGDEEQDPMWLLLFELLQWRGHEETFEDLAIEYAQRFNRCAPGYETSGVIAMPPEDLPPVSDSKWEVRDATIHPPSAIHDGDAEGFLAKLEAVLASHGQVRVDASHLKSIEYDAATAFGRFLSMAGYPKEKVVVVRPNELVRVLLEIVGASPFVLVEPRRR